jgi:hypothetical protein
MLLAPVPFILLIRDIWSPLRVPSALRLPQWFWEITDKRIGRGTFRQIRGHSIRHIQRKLAQKYLPKQVANQRKQGFGLPLGSW